MIAKVPAVCKNACIGLTFCNRRFSITRRFQVNCPVCEAVLLFELTKEHEGKRARIACPRCSQKLEAATALDSGFAL